MSATVTVLADHLWQSTVCAAIAWLLSLILKNNRAHVRYCVWVAASVKFVVPFAALSAFGAALAAHSPAAVTTRDWMFIAEAIGEPFSRTASAPSPTTAVAESGASVAVVLTLLLATWLVGCAAVITMWLRRWRLLAGVVRQSEPLREGRELETLRRLEARARVRRPITLVISDASIEPGVLGLVSPTLLWPQRMTGRLSREQIEAILAHEVCHVRRRDNLVAALHMAVEALFWFHPLVWWIGTRLVAERERACDEDVVRLGSAPHAYAESILATCRFCLESPLACVAGVTGSDLRRRIEGIMTAHRARPVHRWQRVLLATTALAVTAGPIVVGTTNAQQPDARVQPSSSQPSASQLSFEVASIRPNRSSEQRSRLQAQPGGRLTATNVTLHTLVRNAYELQEHQIDGGLAWIKSDRFDIAAKAEGNPARPEMQAMLQTLLAERFKLVTHTARRELPVYALTLSRRDGQLGPQLKRSSGDCEALTARGTLPAAPPQAGARPNCGIRMSPGSVIAGGVSLVQFARNLSPVVGRTVIDRTGLTGTFDIDLQWTSDPTAMSGAGGAAPPSPPDGPSIFTAVQEQLGLKLESQRGAVDVLVIDRAEKPTVD